MPTALEYAKHLVYLASLEPEADKYAPITPLQLQKLLYYVQGWSLATRNAPAFNDRIKAWKNGPVIPGVWHEYRDYGHQNIQSNLECTTALSSDDRSFVEAVWERYKKYSASELWRMTHLPDTPWSNARLLAGKAEGETSDEEITVAMMNEYFIKLNQRLLNSMPAGFVESELDQARRDIAAGRGRNLKLVLAERGHAI